MKTSILFILLAFFVQNSLNAQPGMVSGEIDAGNSVEVSILNIFPDSFPQVTAVFKAETKLGEPVWGLKKQDIQVFEDQIACDVVTLEPLSKSQPINIGIVLDHSGSMGDDGAFKLILGSDGTFQFIPDPKNKVGDQAIDYAKAAIRNFIHGFDSSKDKIGLIGFSDCVDVRSGMGQNKEALISILDTIQATYSTALYDGMIEGLEMLQESDGLKVLITLTDGMNNSSKNSLRAVLATSKRLEIPLYMVGLGSVEKDTLAMLSEETNGRFIYSESPQSLDTVYSQIRKQLQAFYHLVYASENFASADGTRSIELKFDIDSTLINNSTKSYSLPSTVISHLQQREKERRILLGGAIAVVSLIGIGLLVLSFKRRSPSTPAPPSLTSIYPNPTTGLITIDYTGSPERLHVLDHTGRIVKRLSSITTSKQVDLSSLPDGTYSILLEGSSGWSDVKKLIIQH